MIIKYGTYQFPSPTPIVSESDTPVRVGGKFDHSINEISIEGVLTGDGISELNSLKNAMISGLYSDFQDLTISGDSGKVFAACKTNGVSFEDSDITTFLPYKTTFRFLEEESFSNYFGVESPVDSWSFQETEGKILSCSHNVSAKGHRTASNSALESAKTFVDARVGNGVPDGISAIFANTGSNPVIVSIEESINELDGVYSVSERFLIDEEGKYPFLASGASVTCKSSISYQKDGELTVSINGSIQGDITGSEISTGDFTLSEATGIANLFVGGSISDLETGFYEYGELKPTSFSYDTFPKENKVSFSYQLAEVDESALIGNVFHSYSTTVDASKEDGVVKISVKGDLTYKGVDSPVTGDFVDSQRFIEVESAFSGIDPRNFAVAAFEEFKEELGSEYGVLSSIIPEKAASEQITKNPSSQSISYNYQYTDKIDFSSGVLTDLNVSISNQLPIEETGLFLTINGFAEHVIGTKAGNYAVSASCKNSNNFMNDLINVVEAKSTKGYFTTTSSKSIGVNTIGYNLSRFYQNV